MGSLPPSSLPIWASEQLVSSLIRYIATCRAKAVSLSLLRLFRSKGVSWKLSATASSIRLGVRRAFLGSLLAILSSASAANSGVSKALTSLA